jgi:hypothetical protein
MGWVRLVARFLAALTVAVGSGVIVTLIVQAVSPTVFMEYVMGLYAYNPVMVYGVLLLWGLAAFTVCLALPTILLQYTDLPYVKAYFEGSA